jgi:hypothetical protein
MEEYVRKPNISLKTVLLSTFCLLSFNLPGKDTTESGSLTSEVTSSNLRYPERVVDRGIMPVGIINFDTKLKTVKFAAWNVNLASQFGIVPDLQGELGYDIDVTKASERPGMQVGQTFSLGTRYSYLSLPHTAFSATVSLPFYVRSGGEIVRDITFGLPTAFYNNFLAGGILGDLLTLTMRPNVEMALSFPFWFGVQAYGNLWAEISSSFGKLEMKNPDNQAKWTYKSPKEALPVTLYLTYVLNPYVDVGASFGFEHVLKPENTMKLGVNFSFRGGRLFG